MLNVDNIWIFTVFTITAKSWVRRIVFELYWYHYRTFLFFLDFFQDFNRPFECFASAMLNIIYHFSCHTVASTRLNIVHIFGYYYHTVASTRLNIVHIFGYYYHNFVSTRLCKSKLLKFRDLLMIYEAGPQKHRRCGSMVERDKCIIIEAS